MKKRILTLVLALVMVCSLLPVTAMAENTLTVTFDANGGSGTMTSQVITGRYDELNPNEFTREYYAFDKWNTAPDGNGTTIYDGEMVDRIWPNGSSTTEITLYAQWKPFLWVGGVNVTSANADDILDDGKVSYDADTNTLTLNGATITGDAMALCGEGILAFGDLTIKLTGANEVTSSISHAILVDGGNLTIEGNGTLTATSSGNCIQAHGGDLDISDVTVSAESFGETGRGIYAVNNAGAGGDITITNSAVTATGKTYGICAGGGNFTISGSTVTAEATTTRQGATAYGIYGNNVTITDSTVTATAASPSHSYGIIGFGYNNGFVAINGGTVTAKGGTAAVNAVSGVSVANYLGNYQWTITEGGPMTSSGVQEYSYANNGSATYLKIEPLAAAPIVPVTVTGVTLDATTLELAVGGTETLTATVAPDDATNKAVTWSSSDESVATVADGVVTAVAEGDAIITVTTEDGGKTATCAVTVTATATDSDIPTPNPKPTYPIKKVSSDKGSFSVDSSAAEGETVIITVTPDDGYDVRNLTIIDADGKAIMFKSLGNNQFSFVMPAGEVTVSVTFIESGNNGGTVVKPSFPNGYYPIIPDEEQVETTTSPKTFDSGIALSVGMILLSVTGSAWLGKKKD